MNTTMMPSVSLNAHYFVPRHLFAFMRRARLMRNSDIWKNCHSIRFLTLHPSTILAGSLTALHNYPRTRFLALYHRFLCLIKLLLLLVGYCTLSVCCEVRYEGVSGLRI